MGVDCAAVATDPHIVDAEFEVIEGPLRIERDPARDHERFWKTPLGRFIFNPDYWRTWWAPYRAWLLLALVIYLAGLALLRPWLLAHFGSVSAAP